VQVCSCIILCVVVYVYVLLDVFVYCCV